MTHPLVTTGRPVPFGSVKHSLVSHFYMTRGMILAILAFSLLLLLNMTLFTHFAFHTLSKKMVTEKLMEGLHQANKVIEGELNLDLPENPLDVSRKIAPQLHGLTYFRALVVLDEQGRVIHREAIGAQFIRRTSPKINNSDQMKMVPVSKMATANPRSPQFALEYDEGLFDREVDELRSDLRQRLWIAVFISLALLAIGLAFVIWSYKHNKKLQQQAMEADRLAYVGTLASGLAHEIRNPLNSMNMNVQLIQEELEELQTEVSEDMLEMLDGTRNEIGRLEALVSSFLAFARPTQLETRQIQINDVVENTLQFLAPEIRDSGVDLRMNLDPKLPIISADDERLKQALMNVVQNAIQVLRPKEVLEVTTRVAGGDNILIVIRDEGPGISAEELKHIFKVFYSSKRGGTGLGLAMAQRIAELHNGGIKVDSEVGVGSTFTFIIPMNRGSNENTDSGS